VKVFVPQVVRLLTTRHSPFTIYHLLFIIHHLLNGFFSIRPVFFSSEPTFESSFWFIFVGSDFLTSLELVGRATVGAGLAAEEEAAVATFLVLTLAAGDTVGSLCEGVASEAVAAIPG